MSPNTCDLHLHTFYSDGRASPQELIAHAASIGLQTVAITDHDTTQGAREALPLARQYGITLIPAIELTCRWDASSAPPGQTDVDVLGYFPDLSNALFVATEQAALADIQARTAMCCVLLTQNGHPVTLEDVLAQNPRYAGIVPLIQALLHKCQASDWPTATALIEAQWQHVRPSALVMDQVIAAIHAAGGVAVLAHPSAVWWKGGRITGEGLAMLVEMGLDGIEIYHPRLDARARDHFLALARSYSLLVTGGSDEHGWPLGFRHMGQEGVTQDMLEALAARAARMNHGGKR